MDNFNSTSPNHSSNHSPNHSQNHSENHSQNHSPNHDNQDMKLEPQNNQSPPSPEPEQQDNIMPLENNTNNMNSIPEGNNLSNENSEENDETKKKQVKRRSKREIEGRNYICKMCSKSYLSYPALYTHYKQKHNTNNSSGRGRGRPKKENNEGENEKNNYNPINNTFFMKEGRTGKTSAEEINDCIETAFREIYVPDKERIILRRGIKFYHNLDEHPFLIKFKNDPHDINKKEDEQQKADFVFIDYLNKMSVYCNPEYYVKLIKFVTLFREHSNLINAPKVINNEGNKVYTEIFPAEDVPDTSNEFITDFLNPEENNDDLGFSKEDAIDLTQNLCYWMYENNFTCSKLSLIRDK